MKRQSIFAAALLSVAIMFPAAAHAVDGTYGYERFKARVAKQVKKSPNQTQAPKGPQSKKVTVGIFD